MHQQRPPTEAERTARIRAALEAARAERRTQDRHLQDLEATLSPEDLASAGDYESLDQIEAAFDEVLRDTPRVSKTTHPQPEQVGIPAFALRA